MANYANGQLHPTQEKDYFFGDTVTFNYGTPGAVTGKKLFAKVDPQKSFLDDKTLVGGHDYEEVATFGADNSASWTIPLEWANYMPEPGFKIKFKVEGSEESSQLDTFELPVYRTVSMNPDVNITMSDVNGYKDYFGGFVFNQSQIKIDATITPKYSEIIISSGISEGKTGNPLIIVEYPNAEHFSYTFPEKALKIYDYMFSCSTSFLLETGPNAPDEGVDEVIMPGVILRPLPLTILDWFAPQITSISAVRCDENGTESDDGNFAKVNYTVNFAPVNNKNTKALKILTNNGKNQTWNETTVAVNNYQESGEVIVPCSADFAWVIKAEATDYFTSTTNSVKIPIGYTLIDFKASGTGISFGKGAEFDNRFECNLDYQMNKNIYIKDESLENELVAIFGNDILAEG